MKGQTLGVLFRRAAEIRFACGSERVQKAKLSASTDLTLLERCAVFGDQLTARTFLHRLPRHAIIVTSCDTTCRIRDQSTELWLALPPVRRRGPPLKPLAGAERRE